jgi:hypothetical protein
MQDGMPVEGLRNKMYVSLKLFAQIYLTARSIRSGGCNTPV